MQIQLEFLFVNFFSSKMLSKKCYIYIKQIYRLMEMKKKSMVNYLQRILCISIQLGKRMDIPNLIIFLDITKG
jgi:hypothetical protein